MMKRLVASLLLFAMPSAAAAQVPSTPAPEPVPALAPAGIQATGKASASAVVSTVIARVDIHRAGGDDGADLLARMKAAGVADATIDTGVLAGYGMLSVHGHLTDITRAKLEAVSHAVSDVGTNQPRQLAFVHFYGLAADCPAIEQRAREAALADAKRRAQAIAALGTVRLGDTIAVTEQGGCQRPGPFGGSFAIDTETLSMFVPIEETVTYAIVR